LSDKFAKLSDVKKEDYAEGITKLPDDRQREIRQVEGLTDQDQRTLGRNLSQGWMRQRMQEMKDFFKLSAEERLAALDKAIADMDARRGMRGAGGPNAPAGGQPPAAGTGPTGGPPGGRRPRSADRMQQGMEQRLSNTTPEDRAVSYEYRRLLQERRRQLQAAGR
jgi:hypothetical protein